MSKLISAGFQRLFHSLCFKVYLIFAALCSLFFIVIAPTENNLDDFAFSGIMIMSCCAAVFTAMFIGRDYSDGAIRNKLAIGRRRMDIYLSNLVLCAAANTIALFVNFAVMFGVGIPAIGTDMTFSEIARLSFGAFIANFAVTAVFLFFAMLISSKAACTAVLILASFFMFIFSMFIESRLNEPEYYGGMEMVISDDGEIRFEDHEPTKNPYYPSGNTRKVFEFLKEFLPSSQLSGIEERQPVDLPRCAAYDAVVLILFTGAGIFLFGKKDIK